MPTARIGYSIGIAAIKHGGSRNRVNRKIRSVGCQILWIGFRPRANVGQPPNAQRDGQNCQPNRLSMKPVGKFTHESAAKMGRGLQAGWGTIRMPHERRNSMPRSAGRISTSLDKSVMLALWHWPD
jgi:hypothetical protein